MKADDRRVAEGLQYQGIEEQIIYSLTTTNWGSSPTSPSVKAYDETAAYADVSATVLSGSPSVAGDAITLPTVKSLTADHRYRIEVQFTVGGNVFEAYFVIVAQR